MIFKILFVDDEERILNGMKRMLRKMKNEWDMQFVISGEEAIKALDKDIYHVVVSDMRMPFEDGATLLEKVRQKQPGTLRIILSGFSEEESIIRTIGPAHQYLAKPCTHKLLIEAIRGGIELKQFIDSDEIRDMASGLDSLPTPSTMLCRLLDELDSPSATGQSVADLIGSDISLTTQTLRLTNSAFFSLPSKATTPLQAVSILGLNTIRAIILKAGIFEKFKSTPEAEASLSNLSFNCMTIAEVAGALAKDAGCDTTMVRNAHCAGFLSHLGTILLMIYYAELFHEAAKSCEKGNLAIYDTEKKLIGVGHAELGAYLLGFWGFSVPIIEAVAYHHNPLKCSNTSLSPLTFVHAAQFFCSRRHNQTAFEDVSPLLLDISYFEQVGVIDRLDDWKKIAELILKKEQNEE